MLSRRDFHQTASTRVVSTAADTARKHRTWPRTDRDGISVNDVHSHLNPTRVRAILQPQSIDAVQAAVRAARADGRALSVAGGRHAMGGQQFAEGATLIDMSGLARVLELDRVNGEIEVEAGIQWPALYKYLTDNQQDVQQRWAFVQKQTGADNLTIGGALAANVHGRGLQLPPFVGDVAAFTIVGADGVARRCSRTENAELFRAAIGGYGLFGVIVSVRLRLTRRHLVQRIVEVIDIDDLPTMFERRIAEGFEYGDFQFATEPTADALMRAGVFSCYRPVDESTPVPAERASLKAENWRELILLAHVDRARAFQAYSSYYLTTSGQYYWSDEHQMSTYIPDYHEALGDRLGAHARGSEMITEIYVPRESLVRFMSDVRNDFLRYRTDLIYGTIRLIERDTETMLAWAKEPYACIIFNIHVMPGAAGVVRAMQDFRRLIDRGLSYGGSYYLTYHRWAERGHVIAAYPQFAEFLRLKQRLDPAEVFQSEWYRHYRSMFADQIG
jgi:FAD/FMN-containing dehydrogenase